RRLPGRRGRRDRPAQGQRDRRLRPRRAAGHRGIPDHPQRRQGDRVRGDRRVPPVATTGPVHPADQEPRMTAVTPAPPDTAVRQAPAGAVPPNPPGGRSRLRAVAGFAFGAALLFAVAPLVLSDFRLALLAKYLCVAMVAVGIGIAWGRGGMLTLGQGVFFGLGGYAMAMHLKLADAGPGGMPDFMQLYGQLDELP